MVPQGPSSRRVKRCDGSAPIGDIDAVVLNERHRGERQRAGPCDIPGHDRHTAWSRAHHDPGSIRPAVVLAEQMRWLLQPGPDRDHRERGEDEERHDHERQRQARDPARPAEPDEAALLLGDPDGGDRVAELGGRLHGPWRRDGELDERVAVVHRHRRSTFSARSSAFRAFDSRHLIVPTGAPSVRAMSASGCSSW